MPYYTVPRIGTGTDRDPYRPAMPPGSDWVGQTSATGCLVRTPATLPPAIGRVLLSDATALGNVATRMGLELADVQNWRVG